MVQQSMVLINAAGRWREPASMPGYLAGRAPHNKGMQYPADPPPPEEIILVMRQAGHDRHGLRIRAPVAVLWRGGLRISEPLALNETDIDERRGSILVRRGLCRIRHKPAYAECLVMPSGVVRTAVSGLRSKSLTTVLGIITARRKASAPVECVSPPIEGCKCATRVPGRRRLENTR
jgi:hypothetical protein